MVGLPPFGSNVFGNSTPLFGNQSNTNTGLFGPSTSLGQQTSFGQSSNTQNVFGFGNASNSPNSFNPTQSQSTTGSVFGSKPAFGISSYTPGTFKNMPFNGGSQANASPLFGQTSTPATGNTSIFGSSPFKFEDTTDTNQTGTVIKFNPVTGSDMISRNQTSYPLSTRYMTITTMKVYEGKSIEELRFEDYQANRKGPQQGSSTGNAPFNSGTTATSFTFNSKPALSQGFEQKSPLFGQSPSVSFGTKNTFGMPTTTSSNSPFSASPKPFAPVIATQSTVPFSTSTTSPLNSFGTNNFFGASNVFESQGNNTKTNFLNQNKSSAAAFNTNPTTVAGFGGFGQQKSNFGESKFTSSFGVTNPAQTQPVSPAPGIIGQTQQQSSPFSNNLKFPSVGATTPPSSSGFFSGFGTTQNSTSVNVIQTKIGSNFNNTLPHNSAMQATSQSIPVTPVSNIAIQPSQPPPLFSPKSSIIYDQIMANTRIYPEIPFYKSDIRVSSKNKTRITSPQTLQKVLDDDLKVSPTSSINIPVKTRSPVPKYKSVFFKDIIQDSTLEENIFVNLRARHPRRLFIKQWQKNESPSKTGVFIPNNVDKDDTCNCDDNSFDISNTEGKNGEASDKNCSPGGNFENIASTSSHLGDKNEKVIDKNVTLGSKKSLLTTSTPENSPGIDPESESSFSSPEDNSNPKTKHPTGIICTRPDYYTIPSLDELAAKVQPDGRVIVDNFTIGRRGYGSVYFPERFDVAGINIDKDVHFNLKEIIIYEDDENKPLLGQKLNRPAIVTLEHVFPRDKHSGELITDTKRLQERQFEQTLRNACKRSNTIFIKYQPENGTWIFQVHHF